MAKMELGKEGWTPERIGSLSGKTYVITGTSSGTGFEASRTLLAKGASVVMLNRNPQKTEVTIAALKKEFGADADITFIQMDLAVLDSVRSAAAEVLKKVSSIDGLICNAAIAQVPQQDITVDGFESQLGVNHFGHFLLCGLLFDSVEAAGGRMVMVGSAAYRMGLKRIKFEDLNFDEKYTAWNSYAQSKLAQMMFGFELQRRAKAAGKKMTAQVCHPGAAKTNLISTSAGLLNRIIWKLVAPLIAQSAEKGCYSQLMCATEAGVQDNELYGPTKRGETVGPVGACDLEEHALDREAAAKLWAVSEEKTGLSWSL